MFPNFWTPPANALAIPIPIAVEATFFMKLPPVSSTETNSCPVSCSTYCLPGPAGATAPIGLAPPDFLACARVTPICSLGFHSCFLDLTHRTGHLTGLARVLAHCTGTTIEVTTLLRRIASLNVRADIAILAKLFVTGAILALNFVKRSANGLRFLY